MGLSYEKCKIQLQRGFDPILACLNCLHMLCMPDSCGMFVEETKNNQFWSTVLKFAYLVKELTMKY